VISKRLSAPAAKRDILEEILLSIELKSLADRKLGAHLDFQFNEQLVPAQASERLFMVCRATRFVILAVVLVLTQSAPSAQAPPPAAFPRTEDGKPDLSGFWQVMNTANFDIQDHTAREGVPGGQGVVEGNEIPYQPAALAKKNENFAKRATLDPETKCFMAGVPRITYMPFPFQIMQMSDMVAILYEYAYNIRYIHTNNSPHPDGPLDWWMGDSRGRWEGDTLVVDVIHFNDKTWFDRAGNYHSDALHVVERYTPVDRDRINYQVTIEDPKVFTRPWNMSMLLYRRTEKNFRLMEYACAGFKLEKYYPYPELADQ
jgi:hypothetical protein